MNLFLHLLFSISLAHKTHIDTEFRERIYPASAKKKSNNSKRPSETRKMGQHERQGSRVGRKNVGDKPGYNAPTTRSKAAATTNSSSSTKVAAVAKPEPDKKVYTGPVTRSMIRKMAAATTAEDVRKFWQKEWDARS